MINLPNKLVETWLLLAKDNSKENRQASQAATNNIINVFGNIDVAQVYLDENSKKLTELVVEKA